MHDVEGFILAGGRSRRMGEDKARLRLGVETFVERVARALGEVARRVRVVSGRHEREACGLDVVPDVFENCGALGGIHAALAHAHSPRVLVVSCDLPFVTGGLFARLVELGTQGFDAVVPVQTDGRPQPLCALYARDACLPIAERLLREGLARPRLLLREARTLWVEEEKLSDLDDSALFFLNVNTPDDYRRALDLHGRRAARTNT